MKNYGDSLSDITRTEHLAVARGYEQAAATWREKGDEEVANYWLRLARERREFAARLPLRVVQ